VAETGSPTIDALLEGGVLDGDNVVWITDHDDDANALVSAFLGDPGDRGDLRRRLCFGEGGACRRDGDVVHLSGPDRTWPDQVAELALGDDVVAGSRLAFERVDDLVTRWGPAETLAFYRSICPRLFDRGAIAYWMMTPSAGQSVIEGISRIAQCVFEVRAGQFRVIKAEGRPRRLQGVTAPFETRGGVPTVSREQALGRLGEGLRRTRRERNITQAQMAALAGVTPAAISQAETGRRGLSLDTLIPLCDALQIGIDDLLGTGRGPDPLLVRNDRSETTSDVVPIFDNPSLGPRIFQFRIEAGESVTPPFPHKGPELLLIADGLVVVDLGDSTPVLRAGDALRMAGTPIRRLTNLGDRAARAFWIAVDVVEATPSSSRPPGPMSPVRVR